MKSRRSLPPLLSLSKIEWWPQLWKFKLKRIIYDAQDVHPLRRVKRYLLRFYIRTLRLPPGYLMVMVALCLINACVLTFLAAYAGFRYIEDAVYRALAAFS